MDHQHDEVSAATEDHASEGQVVEGEMDQRETDEEATAATGVSELRRRGVVEKCPVCGSHVDAEAYHCPTCRDYFCYHCRARLLLPETQLQCVNQDCNYYGKLICSVCNQQAEKVEPPSIYAEPEDGYWPAWLLLVLFVSAIIWYWFSFAFALLLGIVAFGLGGYALQKMGWNIFGSERVVEQQRRSSYFTCICCEQPAKEVTQIK